MNIASLTDSITASPASAVGGLQPAQVTNGSADATSGGGEVRHHHGGGHMRSAVAAALQSLGLTMPTATDTASSSSTSTSTSTSTSSDGSVTASPGNVQQDMQQFMHQLFEAVRSDSAAATAAGGTSGGTDPQSSFAAGLSTLIGQVGSGTAPAGLQSAFSTLTSALQQRGIASSPSTGGDSGGSGTSDQASLQSFLTALQQTVGYGAASSPIGSLLALQV